MKILLIDDSADATAMLAMLLETQGHSVIAAFSGVSGVALALTSDFDIAIVGLGLPDIDGIDLIKTLHDFCPDKACQIVVLTGRSDTVSRLQAKNAGASHFFVKGRDISELLALTSQSSRL